MANVNELMPQTRRLLQRYGLTSLTNWAYQALISGMSPEQIELELYDQPAFISRFPAIKKREQLGLPPLSVDEYLLYETTVHQLSTMWDIQVSKQEIDELLINDVSPTEVEERFNIAATMVYQTPQEDRDELARLFGVSEGRLAKYWMDPKKELGILQQEATAARIAGSAIRSGYGQITRSNAERLAETGLTPDQAVEGFGQLFTMRELFQPIDEVEQEITQSEQIGFLAGEADVSETIQKRAGKRVAEFAGGGGFAAGEEGFKGIGASTS